MAAGARQCRCPDHAAAIGPQPDRRLAASAGRSEYRRSSRATFDRAKSGLGRQIAPLARSSIHFNVAAEPVKSTLRDTAGRRRTMPDFPLSLIEIERRIAAIRGNLRELEEQAAAISGAAVEELNARRIADQEAQLQRLVTQRDELLQSRSSASKQAMGVKPH